MFDVLLKDSAPAPSLREQAQTALSGILTTQVSLVLPGITKQREYILAKSREDGRKSGRMWKVDLQRADTLLHSLERMLRDPGTAAAARLDPLLQLLDGPLHTLEMSAQHLGARVLPGMARGRSVRILLMPEPVRQRRVQIEELDPENPIIVHSRAPRCYGEVGHSYISWALNRMDFSTLILATVAYLRDN